MLYDATVILGKKFQGTAKKLDDIDLPRIGSQIGVGEDELHAFLEVESRGSGFDDYGRPKILFEPHIFYKHLKGAQLQTAINQGLAYKSWGQVKYPSDSYPRMFKACAINPEAAMLSASWGMTQVMGENYKMLGFKNVFEMVGAFMEDEENHVQGCVDYLIKSGAAKYLKNHDWANVARIYNGSGYKKNQYDTKMKKAFAKWQKIPDTPYDNLRDFLVDKNDTNDPNALININIDDPDAEVLTEVWIAPSPKKLKKGQFEEAGLSKSQVEDVQRRLYSLGYVKVGKIDGKWGTDTSGAVTALQARMGVTQDGHYSAELRQILALEDGSNRYVVSEARKNTTKADLRASGSRTIAGTDSIKSTSKVAGAGLGLMTLGSGIVDYAPQAIQWVAPIKDFFGDLPLWVYGLLGLLFIYVLIQKSNKIADARLDDERTGKNVGSPDPSPNPPLEVIDSRADLPKELPKFLRKDADEDDEDDQPVEVIRRRAA